MDTEILKTDSLGTQKNEIESFYKKEEQEVLKESLIKTEILKYIENTEVKEIIEKMSLNEIVGQIFIDFNYRQGLPSLSGNRILMSYNFTQNNFRGVVEQAEIQTKEVPPFIAIDQEGGKVRRLVRAEGFKELKLPSIKELGEMEDSVVEKAGEKYGELLQQIGVNTLLISLDVVDAGSLMDEQGRSFGTSPEKVRHKAEIYLRGVKSVAPNISIFGQHFPSYNVQENTDFSQATDLSSKNKIISRIAPFSLPLLNGVMISSIVYPELSSEPAVFDKNIVNLARQKNPDLLVMSDDLMAFIKHKEETIDNKELSKEEKEKIIKDVVERAFVAGVDVMMILNPDYSNIAHQHFMSLLKQDATRYQEAADHLQRIIGAKVKMKGSQEKK